jgi:hypothetical protein
MDSRSATLSGVLPDAVLTTHPAPDHQLIRSTCVPDTGLHAGWRGGKEDPKGGKTVLARDPNSKGQLRCLTCMGR